ncbi:MAG: YraN family protein [Elusimicrobiales bacterium]
MPENLGARGEDEAARFLRSLGMKILARGWRCPLGEIDIIAADGQTLVFAEVKTRSYAAFGGPAAAVTKSKRKKIINCAQAYIKSKPAIAAAFSGGESEGGVFVRAAGKIRAALGGESRFSQARFDVIAIIAGEKPAHIKDAFRSGTG